MKTSKQIHLLFICSGLNVIGGLEKAVTSLANLLDENQYKVTILIIDNVSSVIYQLNKDIHLETLSGNFGIGTEYKYIKRKLNFINDIKKVKKKVNSINPDIIISTNYTFTVALAISKLYTKYKLINWEHCTFNTPKSKVWKLFIKWAYKRVHSIVVLNGDEQKSFASLNDNILVIPNFVVPSMTTSNLTEPVIITIARFDKAKGIDLLLQTASIVLQKYQEWKWILIGNGNLMNQYKFEINKYGLNDNFIHLQATSQNITDYEYASILALPSRKESFGMVLIEAMNYGLPCIAFDCETGPRHIISHKEDGLLVERENPYKLAEAISLLIEKVGLRKEMGIAAKRNVSRFYSDSVLQLWDDLFIKLLNNHSCVKR